MKFRKGSRILALALHVVAALAVLVSAAVCGDTRYRTIYKFRGIPNGWDAIGVPAVAKNGDLYGVTGYGGSSDAGTVFKLTAPQTRGGVWKESVLYDFPGNGQQYPTSVILGSDGNLYGVNSTLTIFELKAPASRCGAWKYVPLYMLNGSSDGSVVHRLVFGKNENLYGTTELGGYSGCGHGGCGTVFELKRPAQIGGKWRFRVLHTFTGKPDGDEPWAGVTFDEKGNLYGTTFRGGANDWGAVFRLKPPTKKGQGWKETVLYSFDPNNNDIISPEGPVTVGSSGNLYGTTPLGGDLNCAGGFGCGVVFELSPPTQGKGWIFTSLYAFQAGNDGAVPGGYMVFDSSGNLYGATQQGGGNGYAGAAFRLSPPSGGEATVWTEITLHRFIAPEGAGDTGGLAWGKWGYLYGVTMFGGGGGCQGLGCGTAFELRP
jgi:uncharacterized repeat protein (TIGR03803 family)